MTTPAHLRTILVLLALAVGLIGPIAIAQDPPPKRMGVLSGFGCGGRMADLVRQRLAELGWVEGKNLVVDCLSTLDPDELRSLTRQLIGRRPDVLVSTPLAYVRTLKEETSSIPIVMVATTDPVENGLITNLARPEGNLTGLASSTPQLIAKRVDLLKELLPRLARFAVIYPSRRPGATYPDRVRENVTLAATKLGITWQAFQINGPEELDSMFAQLGAESFDAVYMPPNPMFYGRQKRIVELAQQYRIATVSDTSEFAQSGFLLTYGAEPASLWLRGAEFVDKILRGAQPGDLPVEQPARFNLVINQKTAKWLDIAVPPSMLARADEVIE
jgi:putative tryptophan/tyrosine transport system substrate-binding protein